MLKNKLFHNGEKRKRSRGDLKLIITNRKFQNPSTDFYIPIDTLSFNIHNIITIS